MSVGGQGTSLYASANDSLARSQRSSRRASTPWRKRSRDTSTSAGVGSAQARGDNNALDTAIAKASERRAKRIGHQRSIGSRRDGYQRASNTNCRSSHWSESRRYVDAVPVIRAHRRVMFPRSDNSSRAS